MDFFQAAFSVVLLCPGVLLILAGTASLWPTVKLCIRGQQTTGKLVWWRQTFYQKFHRGGLEVRRTCFYPVVRFQAADGSEYRVESGEGHETKPNWPIGHPFAVRYDPSNPSNASVEGTTQPWKVSAAILIVGAALVLAAIYLWH
jgi:hypothetical protein